MSWILNVLENRIVLYAVIVCLIGAVVWIERSWNKREAEIREEKKPTIMNAQRALQFVNEAISVQESKASDAKSDLESLKRALASYAKGDSSSSSNRYPSY